MYLFVFFFFVRCNRLLRVGASVGVQEKCVVVGFATTNDDHDKI